MAQIIADLPVSVTVAGVTANGARTSVQEMVLFAAEGKHESYQFSVYVRAADFATAPDTDDTATIGGVAYRILQRQDSPDGRLYRLDLGEGHPRK